MISVLVAAVGVLGTALGAGLTAVIAARAESRRQAALEREQARKELMQKDNQVLDLRVEHFRWRRERRQTAYLEFLQALAAADRANLQEFRTLKAATPPEPFAVERIAEIRRLFKHAEQAGDLVLLEGPDQVAAATHELILQFGTLVQAVRDFAEAHSGSADDLPARVQTIEAIGERYLAARLELIRGARVALDEIIDIR
ncbi:hypothetical protein NS506_02655 [Nocardia seriolae]|uniref:Secreted protein n=1 Tax=Nocardia seriolae TaxID=37332 RepID=A0ABC8ARX1_9NOCA|nr:hypothetical protein [Nocardia seriolae]APA96717.1 hypothetical protein NS506_02655 [Nocardia seriolae]